MRLYNGWRRWQVVTWSSDIGSDDHMDYEHKADAFRDAKRYKGQEDYVAVFDHKDKVAIVVWGDPKQEVFIDSVKVRNWEGNTWQTQ